MLSFKSRINLFLIFVFQCVMFFVFSKIDFIIQWFGLFFEWKKSIHIPLFSQVSFSVGDIIYSFLGIYLVFLIFKILVSKRKKIFQIHFLILLNVFYFVYQIFLGMQYFQPPILDKLPKKHLTEERLRKLTLKYLQLCQYERERVGEDSSGVFQIRHISEVKREVIKAQNFLPKNIIKKTNVQYQSIKPSLFAKYFNFSGILGYYNPFTAEAQYHEELPSTYIPFTISHEVAHQMGYAREQEANFLGYLLGVHSQNSDIKYSTYYFVLKNLLNALRETNPNYVKQILKQYSPAMKRDRAYEIWYREKNEGVIDEILYITNDLFLKSNQQEGSVTYSYFLDLLNAYEGNLE